MRRTQCKSSASQKKQMRGAAGRWLRGLRQQRGLSQRGLARKVGPGDVLVNLPGTPHWLSQIDGTIEYVEIAVPNVDPAPGVERAEVRPAAPR